MNIKNKDIREELLNEFTNETNRSTRQTLELYSLCSDLKELQLVEKAIKYLFVFYCPSTRYEVLIILTQYRINKWLNEELFPKY